jgi:hypothetical protein
MIRLIIYSVLGIGSAIGAGICLCTDAGVKTTIALYSYCTMCVVVLTNMKDK